MLTLLSLSSVRLAEGSSVVLVLAVVLVPVLVTCPVVLVLPSGD